MVYIVVACVVLLVLLRFTSPALYATRASRSSKIPFWIRAKRRQPRLGPLRDTDGKCIDTRGKLLGFAYGDSLPDHIPNGALYVAEYLDDHSRRELISGDVVVVDAPAGASVIKKRLRVVDTVVNGEVQFRSDPLGKPHRPRPLEQVAAKVEWAQASN
jgi:hypothetical protein